MPIISGPAGMDPILGRMRTKDIQGGTASGNYTFNSAEFTVGAAGLVSLNQVPSSKLDTTMDIVNVTGTSVTLQPNTAYKMYATTRALNVTANPPAANKWAYEGHAEIFVGSVGYAVFDTSKIVLANQLEPDSVNNCTLRFHDGMCYVSVEDHIAGYIVINVSTSGEGSLAYGIANSTNDYMAFDASLNGQTIPLAGATAEGEKHIVGNGYTETAITGAVNCGTSKFTVANLGLNNVQITGGIMTLSDAYIPSGSTVAVSGGGLAVEKVTGNGAIQTITDGNDGALQLQNNGIIDGLTISGSTSAQRGAGVFVNVKVNATIKDCKILNCFVQYGSLTYGSGIAIINSTNITIEGCLFAGNNRNGIYANTSTLTIRNCEFSENTGDSITLSSATATLDGTNKIKCFLNGFNNTTVVLTPGAILDLTGNTNSTPIAPGGGIIVDGGCQVITSAGSTVSIAGGTYTKLNNDGTTE